MHRYNDGCDGDRCQTPRGEVRLLPYGGGGNLILCRDCYRHEIGYRKARGETDRKWLPEWEDLHVYGDG